MLPNDDNRLSRQGFTLVEIMVVVVIIGLLAAVGLPTFRQITMKSKATTLINDVRQFTTSLQTYNHQNGRWPAESDPGVIPTEMAGSLSPNFAKPTSLGGMFDWDNDVSPGGISAKAAVTVATANGYAFTNDAALVEMVDSMMDDGDLTKGSVQYNAGSLVFILEK
ncbi:MAG TPA: prepilin-type N-terminal cleavage/methylation domain-containing protein [Opitutaceae bacterium]|nr:prepilin-type N-terminal cleavage/methylation domain-containing protein [Opitutaceae bacterium]